METKNKRTELIFRLGMAASKLPDDELQSLVEGVEEMIKTPGYTNNQATNKKTGSTEEEEWKYLILRNEDGVPLSVDNDFDRKKERRMFETFEQAKALYTDMGFESSYYSIMQMIRSRHWNP